MTSPDAARPLDPTEPAQSRRYASAIGDEDAFRGDRLSLEAIMELLPQFPTAARANRAFVERAAKYLAAECGIRSFLDIGCGLPHAPNVHEIAQQIDPACRVVYVDNDAMVAVHSQVLHVSTPQGATATVHADLRDHTTILREAARTLDLTRPVGLLLCAAVHFIDDDTTAIAAFHDLTAALAPGSYLVLSHATYDPLDPTLREKLDKLTVTGAHGAFRPRTGEQVAELLTGWDLVDPGLVSVKDWRPDTDPVYVDSHTLDDGRLMLSERPADLSEADVICYAAVARKP